MGRHHAKLPEHLLLPQHQASHTVSSTYYLSLKSVSYASPAALFTETSHTALAVGDRIPGFKTSAAFLNSLRSNLILEDDSTPASLTNTPDSLRPTNMASSTGSLIPPSPLAQSSDLSPNDDTVTAPSPPQDPLSDVPDLTTTPATTQDSKVDVLKLVADSVAQQRQIASSLLIWHPLNIAIMLLFLAVTGQYLYKGQSGDYALIATTYAGIVMAGLISVRWATSGYLYAAEEVGTWKWLDLNRERDGVDQGVEDSMLLMKFGKEPVGAIVVRGVLDRKGSPKKNSKRRTGEIRGWAVKNKYRNKGLGTGLIEETVKLCREKGWAGPVLAEDHANNKMILYSIYNGGFEHRAKKAKALLERVVEENSGSNVKEAEGKRVKK